MTFAPRLAKQEVVNLRSPTANSLKQLTLRHANSIIFGSHGWLSRVKIRIRGVKGISRKLPLERQISGVSVSLAKVITQRFVGVSAA